MERSPPTNRIVSSVPPGLMLPLSSMIFVTLAEKFAVVDRSSGADGLDVLHDTLGPVESRQAMIIVAARHPAARYLMRVFASLALSRQTPSRAGGLRGRSQGPFHSTSGHLARRVARSSVLRETLMSMHGYHDELDLLDQAQNEAEQQADDAGLTGFDRRQ